MNTLSQSFGGLRVLTFEGTSSNGLYDITSGISDASLILVNARIDFDTTSIVPPKSINISVGNTVSHDNIIDNNPATNYLKLMIDHNPQTVATVATNVSVTYPNAGYKISGDLTRQASFSLRDSTGALLGANLLYFFVQFQVI